VSRNPPPMTNPIPNRGTAFTRAERLEHGMIGRLPAVVETLEQQAQRCYRQLQGLGCNIDRYVFLEELQNRNETLYYKLLVDHLVELLPVIYDPTVGEAIKKWSHAYRRSRAVYLSIDHIEDVRPSFETLELGPEDVDLLVVSDSEQILGIGDWGVNGTDISIGKLAVYTAAAGIRAERSIAVNLDVGTDNAYLLNDPSYLGNRHARVRGERYDELIHEYLEGASELYPHALLHFEDFGASNARRILVQNAANHRIFNDDMQGTAAIVLAAVISVLKVTRQSFADQRLIVYGAGTAGTGIADQIRAAMISDGLSLQEAVDRIWLVDRNGLVTDDMKGLPDYQEPYAKPFEKTRHWAHTNRHIGLTETIRRIHPTILLGTSTAHDAFTQQVVDEMCREVERPIIMPLSNPTEKIEAMPADVIAWSKGKALVSVGIPVAPFHYEGTRYEIGQGNNALLYPGLGLGVIVSGAERVSARMIRAAAEAVDSQVDPRPAGSSLLPAVENLRASSATVAVAVVQAAIEEGLATKKPSNVVQAVQDAMWGPHYPPVG